MTEGRIVLAGNPNVGKSTVFNYLTGMKQHTGNWSGKTVGIAVGKHRRKGREIEIVDLPGAYSLAAASPEEEITRDFLCFEKYDGAVVVCDACCLERNLIFALQVSRLVPKTLICVNMLDDARKKGIDIDIAAISEETGLPAIGISAAGGEGIEKLSEMIFSIPEGKRVPIRYPKETEKALAVFSPVLNKKTNFYGDYAAAAILGNERGFVEGFERRFGKISRDEEMSTALSSARELYGNGDFFRLISASFAIRAEEICLSAVRISSSRARERDRKADSVLTGRLFGIPAMLILFGLIFWITVFGANIPSELLSEGFEKAGILFERVLLSTGMNPVLRSLLVDGVWNVLSWVVAVMLPPMAIFFPLFTILEDVGYLPRVAYNLDRGFKTAGTCGKQALTMCMGLGCGAVGVTGARIIDSPRERLIAIITNSFVPCNGRLPAIMTLAAMFFGESPVIGAAVLTGALVLSVLMTFLASKILSKTVLKGMSSGFVLELPPYRLPKIGRVVVRSVFDRTAKILGRAIIVAVPAGIIIWLCSNLFIGERTVLGFFADMLDPFARLFGLDGNVLFGFILSLPANEIALPVMAMGYSGGAVLEAFSLSETAEIFMENGFGISRAVCTLVFILFHWPCATTLITIFKETKSIKWTAFSVLVPLLCGISLCFIINIAFKLFSS